MDEGELGSLEREAGQGAICRWLSAPKPVGTGMSG